VNKPSSHSTFAAPSRRPRLSISAPACYWAHAPARTHARTHAA
jgi:hypothetical protein